MDADAEVEEELSESLDSANASFRVAFTPAAVVGVVGVAILGLETVAAGLSVVLLGVELADDDDEDLTNSSLLWLCLEQEDSELLL